MEQIFVALIGWCVVSPLLLLVIYAVVGVYLMWVALPSCGRFGLCASMVSAISFIGFFGSKYLVWVSRILAF